MHIIRVPSVFSCKLPGGEWINFDRVRSMKIVASNLPQIALIWDNGDVNFYAGQEAFFILEAWNEASSSIDKSYEVGFVEGQLLAWGSTPELIDAVSSGDDRAIETELKKIESLKERDRLLEIIQQIGPVIGRRR